ncbi:MAG: hypothetical protein ABI707_08765 [Ferruginibacter sp.]
MSEEKNIPEEQVRVINPQLVPDINIASEPVDEQARSANDQSPAPLAFAADKETKTMEIHHHPQDHHKKKWKDYLFEFLMLFLAVSAGFFVENQREHYVEHNRAKQYAYFLYRDLLRDTVNLNERSAFIVAGTKKLDTLIAVLKSYKDNDTSATKIYALSAYAYSGAFFSATTSTMEQLKNSGSLRYFGNNDLISNFSNYDTDLQRLKAVEDRNAYLNEEIRKFLVKFLDLKSISRFTVNTSSDASGFKLLQPSIAGPLKLYKKDPEQFEQYANLCALKQLDWNTRAGLQMRLFNSASKLIISLKKEYHLE